MIFGFIVSAVSIVRRRMDDGGGGEKVLRMEADRTEDRCEARRKPRVETPAMVNARGGWRTAGGARRWRADGTAGK